MPLPQTADEPHGGDRHALHVDEHHRHEHSMSEPRISDARAISASFSKSLTSHGLMILYFGIPIPPLASAGDLHDGELRSLTSDADAD